MDCTDIPETGAQVGEEHSVVAVQGVTVIPASFISPLPVLVLDRYHGLKVSQ